MKDGERQYCVAPFVVGEALELVAAVGNWSQEALHPLGVPFEGINFGERAGLAGKRCVVAAVLLLGGGLAALQSAAINTGLPFCLILLAVCVGLGRSLWEEGRRSA